MKHVGGGGANYKRLGSSGLVCFPSKRHESWTYVIFSLGVSLDFDHKDTTETHNDLN
jgi:hypothetical protein